MTDNNASLNAHAARLAYLKAATDEIIAGLYELDTDPVDATFGEVLEMARAYGAHGYTRREIAQHTMNRIQRGDY